MQNNPVVVVDFRTRAERKTLGYHTFIPSGDQFIDREVARAIADGDATLSAVDHLIIWGSIWLAAATFVGMIALAVWLRTAV